MKRWNFNGAASVVIAVGLIAFAVAARLLPHPVNAAPLAAVTLFAAMYLPKKWAIIIPSIAMFASDAFIGFYDWRVMAAVYGSFMLVGLIGLWVRSHKRVPFMVGGTLLGSVLFFLVTNFAVWAFGTMYAHTGVGLAECFMAALPFFRNSLVGDLFYVGALVGMAELFYAYAGVRIRSRVFAPVTQK